MAEKKVSDELFCTKCHKVFMYGTGKCCGKKAVKFDPQKQGRLLVGLSNSWITVWEQWASDPLLEEVSQELVRDGHYGCAIILNEFIRKLKDKVEDDC